MGTFHNNMKFINTIKCKFIQQRKLISELTWGWKIRDGETDTELSNLHSPQKFSLLGVQIM